MAFFVIHFITYVLVTCYLVRGRVTSVGDACSTPETDEFVNKIFQKYGSLENGNYSHIDEIHLHKLMKSVSIGNVVVTCKANDLNCLNDPLATHDYDNSSPSRKRRSTGKTNSQKEKESLADEKKRIQEHENLWKEQLAKCWPAGKLLGKVGINISNGIDKKEFLRVCPALFEQIDSKVCTHYHTRIRKHKHYQDIPSSPEIWGYGFLSITLISILSLAVIGMVPCLKKSYYAVIMAFLVALAVGTLSGDAMLHLIPHAFVEGANTATNITITKEKKLKQHYSQVWRALFVLLGIYVFFIVEQLMKLKALCRGGHNHGGHGHSHRDNKGKSHRLDESNSPVLEIQANQTAIDPDTSAESNGSQAAILDVPYPNHDSPSEQLELEDDMFHSDERHHSHHHGEKNITKDSKISSVAWMVVVGDGFHNFSDGLAVGAAFSASLSSGLSTAIAVFCHELPHELGDFAILIKAGMTIKQAIVYNVVSAVLAYIGLTFGILAGGNELGRHFILSITAGLFLYVSLCDMLPELTQQDIPDRSIYSTFLCQHLGLLSGIGLMLFISLYEHMM